MPGVEALEFREAIGLSVLHDPRSFRAGPVLHPVTRQIRPKAPPRTKTVEKTMTYRFQMSTTGVLAVTADRFSHRVATSRSGSSGDTQSFPATHSHFRRLLSRRCSQGSRSPGRPGCLHRGVECGNVWGAVSGKGTGHIFGLWLGNPWMRRADLRHGWVFFSTWASGAPHPLHCERAPLGAEASGRRPSVAPEDQAVAGNTVGWTQTRPPCPPLVFSG